MGSSPVPPTQLGELFYNLYLVAMRLAVSVSMTNSLYLNGWFSRGFFVGLL